MEEKPVALHRIAETKRALIDLEQAVKATIEQHGDAHGLKAAADRLHRELGEDRAAYLKAREWTEEADFAAQSGGEDKPPREDGPG